MFLTSFSMLPFELYIKKKKILSFKDITMSLHMFFLHKEWNALITSMSSLPNFHLENQHVSFKS